MTIIYILIAYGTLSGIYKLFMRRRKRKKQIAELLSIFKKYNAREPELKFGSSYGWPTCTGTFANKEDYDHAEQLGIFQSFEKKMGSFYGPEFDANLAVFFKYPGMKYRINDDLEIEL